VMAWIDRITTHTHPEHYQELAARHPVPGGHAAARHAAPEHAESD